HQLNTAWMKIWVINPPAPIEVRGLLDAISANRFTSHARNFREHPDPPEFIRISTDGLLIKVRLDKPSNIKFIGAGGKIKKEIKRNIAGSYKVSPKDGYISIKATLTNGYSAWAWTNPIYIDRR